MQQTWELKYNHMVNHMTNNQWQNGNAKQDNKANEHDLMRDEGFIPESRLCDIPGYV